MTALLGLVAAQQRTPAQQFDELQAKLVEDARFERVAGMDVRNPCDLTRAKVIVWSDAETYRPAMLELRAGLLRDHRTLIDACVARKHISPERAAAITLAIDFDIEDRRADPKIPLPKIE